MAAAIVVFSIATRWFGERIGINRGMGWDGETYVQWAADLHHQLFELGTTTYHAQRVLPSVVVHYGLRLVGASLTVPHILLGFHVMNTVLLAAAAVVWSRIGEVMRWRAPAIWVGAAALFLGFANARHALYYPALTDTFAFLLGMVMTWAFLAQRPIALWVVAGLAMVSWPALSMIALALLVLGRPRAVVEPVALPRRWIQIGSALAAIAAAVAFLLLARHYLAHPVQALGIPKFATWVRRDILWITVITLGVMLAAGWYALVADPVLWNVRATLRALDWRRVGLAVGGAVVLFVLRGLWLRAVGTKGPGPSGSQFVCLQTLEALRGPLWGPVHHVVYFGPIVAVAIVHWRAVCRVVASWGHAAVLAFGLLVVFLVASESRQWIHMVPMFVVATIAATEAKWTWRSASVFIVLALVWSKLWLTIGYDTARNWQTFPTQRYFMHLGPWASDTAWLWHGLAALVTIAIVQISFWWVSRSAASSTSARARASAIASDAPTSTRTS